MKISNWILASTLCGFISAGGSAVFAQPISHFNVKGVPETILPGGSINLAIEAIGGDGQIQEDWSGEVSLSVLIPQEMPVISEFDSNYDQVSRLEITNPGLGFIDISGWKIRCLQSYVRHIDPIFEFILPENTILSPESVMMFTDDQTTDEFGGELQIKYPGQFPSTIFLGATQLMNSEGIVVDEVFSGSSDDLYPKNDALWADLSPLVYWTFSAKIWSRVGDKNHFLKDDWVAVEPSENNFGAINPGLELPWEHRNLSIPFETSPIQLVDGKWSGSINIPHDLPPGRAFVRAKTTQNAVGTSTLTEVLALPKLSWRLPDGFEVASENEANQAVEVELFIPSTQDMDISVSLTTSGVGEFEFPESLVIPAGSTSLSVPFTILDDDLVDGLTRLRVIAEAQNFQSGELELLSEDNESGELVFFNKRRTVYEGEDPFVEFHEATGLMKEYASVSVTEVLVNDLVVYLDSDGVIEVPDQVIIPAGSLSKWFDLYIGDDSIVNEYPFYNTVTANVPGWVEVSKQIPVLNNDPYPSTIVNSDLIQEGIPQTITVGLSSPLDFDIVYSIELVNYRGYTSRPSVFPETVTIPAGETSVSFEILFPDNNTVDELYPFMLNFINPMTGYVEKLQLWDASSSISANISFISSPASVLNSEILNVKASIDDPFGVFGGDSITGNLSLLTTSDQLQLVGTANQIQSSEGIFSTDITWEGSALDTRLRIEAEGMVAISEPIDVLDGLGPNFSISEGLWNADNNGLVLFSMDVPQVWQFNPKTGDGLGTIQLPSTASSVQHDSTSHLVWVGLDRSIARGDGSIIGDDIIALIDLDTFQLVKTIQIDIGERNAVREVHSIPGNSDILLIYADFKGSENPALMLIGVEAGILDSVPLSDNFLNSEIVPGKVPGQYFLHGSDQIISFSISSELTEINYITTQPLSEIPKDQFQSAFSLIWIGGQLLRQTGELLDPQTLEITGKLVDENIVSIAPFLDNKTVALMKDDLEILHFNLNILEVELAYTLPRLIFASDPRLGFQDERFFNVNHGVALRSWGDQGLVAFENGNWRRYTDQNCVLFDMSIFNKTEISMDLHWLNESTMEVSFESTSGWIYELKTTDNLVDGVWTKVGESLIGNSASINFSVPFEAGTHFFRLEGSQIQ